MKPLDIPFEYLRNRPRNFAQLEGEILNGCAGEAVFHSEHVTGGPLTLPNLDALIDTTGDAFSDADEWVDALAQDPEMRAKTLHDLNIYQSASALWQYAMESTWTPSLGFDPNSLMCGVRLFCTVARYSSEELSAGAIQVPITLEQLYARAYARFLVDYARDPRIDELEACDDWLRIEDVALLAEVAPQSVRNALNATGEQKLASARTAEGIRIHPAEAHQWLLGRRRYVPTNLDALERCVVLPKENMA